MHMADALVSPAVGGALWLASGALLARSAGKVRQSCRDNLVPLMGVLGAFVFTAQMINFTIPGTGSSGHLGGGLLLAALLGPHAAFIVIASVLTVQALPADGAPAPHLRPVLLGLLAAAAAVGGALSWFASTRPDGLEWSIARAAGSEEVGGVESGLRQRLAALQEQTAVLPDYGFKPGAAEPAPAETWPDVRAGTSVSGLVGGAVTLALALAAGAALRLRRSPDEP